MPNLIRLTPKQSLNKAYLKEKVTRSSIELFKNNLIQFIDRINERESEEYVKNLVRQFLDDTYYHGKNQINTKGRIDLAIYEDKKPVVIIEAKRPLSPEMVSVDNLNTKATHELMLYYLQERVEHGNIDVKYLIITNTYEWFVFDSSVFDNLFYKNAGLMKDFNDWKNGRKARTDRDLFYNDIAKPFLKNLQEEIKFTWFDLRQVAAFARNDNPKDDAKLIDIYKTLSPVNLLKQPFANDSNSLDKDFYSELLHLIGLEEKKDGGKKIIQRKEKPDPGSLLENTINILEAEDRLHKLPGNGSDFGEKKQERLFNVALELCITWINRILFLKLLEGQLLNYHKGDKQYRFLDSKTIPNYDELNKLFFQVLARKLSERTGSTKEKFAHVPYLNSSLFDISALEDDTVRINSLDDGVKLKVHTATVLKNENGKKREGEIPTLQYLLEFLDAYDFTSEGKDEIQEENKTLINASVLGLIFEKINGYKDGSFFTPGFITMYMCRETLRRATVQKFNEAKGWKLDSFEQLYNKIEDIKEANEIVNSLKICDPAVGSGHFLVSALNEIFAIKSDLGILCDRKGNRLREYAVEVVNDELIVSVNDEAFFEYVPGNKESQRVQEALFHEKQTLIENCLFGVDINPNSVKICRLRLWIELLKNAYYTAESKYTELETLPNIDINIKQGNSLISRFPLDADLSKALKSIKYSIDEYRGFVNDYKNATDKEAKRGFEKLIEQIKKDFRTEIGKNDPKVQLLSKKSGELYNLLNQARVFEPTEKEKKEQTKKKEKLEAEIKKLAAEIEEIKNSAIYKDAFEWRFNFPEILDNQGAFLGFDLVIGNPPYGVDVSSLRHLNDYKIFTEKTDSYQLFFKKCFLLAKNSGIVSQIVPNSWMSRKAGSELRHLLYEKEFLAIVNFIGQVFDDASIDTCIVISRNSKNIDAIANAITLKDPAFVLGTVNYNRIPVSKWIALDRISCSLTTSDYLLIEKILSNSRKIEEFFTVIGGYKPYQVGYGKSIYGDFPQTNEDVVKRVYHSTTKISDEYYPDIKGQNIHRFYIERNTQWVKWGPWLMSPKSKEQFTTPKIVMREITGNRLTAAFDESGYFTNDTTHMIISDSTEKLKYLLGLLNSKLFGWFFRKFFSEENELFPKIKINEIKSLPIKMDDTKRFKTLILEVDKALNAKATDTASDIVSIESSIDTIVYDIYGISPAEIKIIEGN